MDFGGGEAVPASESPTKHLSAIEAPAIPGLVYVPQFIAPECRDALVARVDREPWRRDLERRVQHYGWRYDYRARTVTRDMRIGPLPEWLRGIARRLYAETGVFDRVPDQAIVNEYLPGQGIAMHADRQCFGPAVATISLCDEWRMDLRPVRTGTGAPATILLEEGSALLLTGESRRTWLHGIAKRASDPAGHGRRLRRRRISLTFRTVLSAREQA